MEPGGARLRRVGPGDPPAMAVPDLREIHSVGAGTRESLVPVAGVPALAEHRIELCGISLASPEFRFVRHAWERSIWITVSR